MKEFDNPLDNIKVASPCSAKWNEMYGDERKRFCKDCSLNVYNLSGMTKGDAENLIIDSEGVVCVQIHRRSDGTILTKNCPVGWKKLKKEVSYIATATFAVLIAFCTGVFSVNLLDDQKYVEEESGVEEGEKFEFGGSISNLTEVKEAISDRKLG